MSVTNGLVAAVGWSMDATFQRDRRPKARPCAADDDDSVGESQGITREQTKEGLAAQGAAIWRRSEGRDSRQDGAVWREKKTNWWWAKTKTTTHLMRGCQRSKQTMRNTQREAANWLILTEGGLFGRRATVAQPAKNRTALSGASRARENSYSHTEPGGL